MRVIVKGEWFSEKLQPFFLVFQPAKIGPRAWPVAFYGLSSMPVPNILTENIPYYL